MDQDIDMHMTRLADSLGTTAELTDRGTHALEVDGESVQVLVEDLGPVTMVQVAVELGSDHELDASRLRHLDGRNHPAMARFHLRTESAGHAITYWLAVSGVIDTGVPVGRRLHTAAQSITGPARRARDAARIVR